MNFAMLKNDGPTLSKDDSSKFQIQKAYIRNLHPNRSPADWEQQLYHHFALFGPIIDLKVLETCKFISSQRTVRVRYL